MCVCIAALESPRPPGIYNSPFRSEGVLEDRMTLIIEECGLKQIVDEGSSNLHVAAVAMMAAQRESTPKGLKA